jgi:hypothetical protein
MKYIENSFTLCSQYDWNKKEPNKLEFVKLLGIKVVRYYQITITKVLHFLIPARVLVIYFLLCLILVIECNRTQCYLLVAINSIINKK